MSAKRRRPGLIAVWILFGLLASSIFALEGLDLMAPSSTEPADTARLFAFAEADLGGIQVVYERQIASLMRGPDGLWYQHDDSHSHGGAGAAQAPVGPGGEHVPNAVQSASISQRLTDAAGMVANRQRLDDADLEAYGLTRSETMIAFYGRGAEGVDYTKPMDVLHIGDIRPGGNDYYARLDGDPDVALIPRDEFLGLLETVFGAGKVPIPGAN